METQLAMITAEVQHRTKTSLSADAIGVKVGEIINRRKVGKHLKLTIGDNMLRFERNAAPAARTPAAPAKANRPYASGN